MRRADLDGNNQKDVYTGLPGFGRGLALDLANAKMYWLLRHASNIIVQSGNMDGSGSPTILLTMPGDPWDIALDVIGNKIFWTDFDANQILRADLDGTDMEVLYTDANDLGSMLKSVGS